MRRLHQAEGAALARTIVAHEDVHAHSSSGVPKRSRKTERTAATLWAWSRSGMPLSPGLVAQASAPPLMLCCEVLSFGHLQSYHLHCYHLQCQHCHAEGQLHVQCLSCRLGLPLWLKAIYVMQMQVRMRTIVVALLLPLPQ